MPATRVRRAADFRAAAAGHPARASGATSPSARFPAFPGPTDAAFAEAFRARSHGIVAHDSDGDSPELPKSLSGGPSTARCHLLPPDTDLRLLDCQGIVTGPARRDAERIDFSSRRRGRSAGTFLEPSFKRAAVHPPRFETPVPRTIEISPGIERLPVSSLRALVRPEYFPLTRVGRYASTVKFCGGKPVFPATSRKGFALTACDASGWGVEPPPRRRHRWHALCFLS